MEEKAEPRKLTIKNTDIEALVGTNAMHQLCSWRSLPVEELFKLEKLQPLMDTLLEAYNATRQSLIERFGDRDIKGVLIQSGTNLYSIEIQAEAFAKELKKLQKLETVIESEKVIVVKSQLPVGLFSKNDITALRCIVDFVEEEK